MLSVQFKYTIPLVVMLITTTATANLDVKKISEEACITAGIYFEARGESLQGMKAVANVIVNRKNSKKYPKSACSVIFQKYQFSFTHQQSWNSIQKVLNGSVSGFKAADKVAYYRAKEIAEKSIKGLVRVLPESSLHYHAMYVKPSWSRKMQKYATIGSHVFYRS